ncbi:uncharacterized protein N7529_008224 [Penicillium soppii]|jgi:hypothetical protein|uniref:uncharacterized protein n=1 Tax=Penicillium soppii TaxID=69789 RepID=UPI002548FAE1|nr:uncharacterized protein N7529_008224 [Penicillium soppii]KAJ5860914.1 hypothetical protein N7529_008224 [Penicillium soppii]
MTITRPKYEAAWLMLRLARLSSSLKNQIDHTTTSTHHGQELFEMTITTLKNEDYWHGLQLVRLLSSLKNQIDHLTL